jgi:hypothetical protein
MRGNGPSPSAEDLRRMSLGGFSAVPANTKSTLLATVAAVRLKSPIGIAPIVAQIGPSAVAKMRQRPRARQVARGY